MISTRYFRNEADKHIKICIQIKEIMSRLDSSLRTYISTYTINQTYQRIEEESGKDFWSLKTYASYPPHGGVLKDPDVVVVDSNDILKYIIEVKWGYFESNYCSDLLDIWKQSNDRTEEQRFIDMIDRCKTCRVRGPRVINGQRFLSNNTRHNFNFKRNNGTRFFLVSDFNTIFTRRTYIFNEFIQQYNSSQLRTKLELFDISNPVIGGLSNLFLIENIRG